MGVGWSQRFAFNRAELGQLLRGLAQHGPTTPQQRRDLLPYGSNKLDGYLYYLQYAGLFDRKEGLGDLTELGRLIVERDPGLFDPGTAFVLHYHLSGHPDATVWRLMSNVVLPQYPIFFTKDQALSLLSSHPEIFSVPKDKVEEDFRFYARALSEPDALGGTELLGVLDSTGPSRGEDGLWKSRKFRRKTPDVIPPLVFAYAAYDTRLKHFIGQPSISVDSFLQMPGGAGRAFHLYAKPEMLRVLVPPLRARDLIGHTRTAELDDLEFLQPGLLPLDILRLHYTS